MTLQDRKSKVVAAERHTQKVHEFAVNEASTMGVTKLSSKYYCGKGGKPNKVCFVVFPFRRMFCVPNPIGIFQFAFSCAGRLRRYICRDFLTDQAPGRRIVGSSRYYGTENVPSRTGQALTLHLQGHLRALRAHVRTKKKEGTASLALLCANKPIGPWAILVPRAPSSA